jgi:L-fuconolactonase
MITDSHVHVVDPGRYPMSPLGGPQVGTGWYRTHALTAGDLTVQMIDAGVDRAVLVQPFSAYGFDNRYTLEAAAGDAVRFRALCTVDPDDQPVQAIEACIERGAAGLRLFSMGRGSNTWFGGRAAGAVWRTLAERGVPLCAAVNGAELSGLRARVEQHVDVTVIIDHCAAVSLAPSDRNSPDTRQLRGLAELPNVYVKVSTITFDAAGSQTSPGDVVGQLVQDFGVERVCWGSNLPATTDRTYTELVGLATTACGGLDPHERELVLGGNAASLWWRAQ